MKNIAVYTCISGKIDDLQTQQNWGNADWFLFTDQDYKGGKWQVKPLEYTHVNSTRRTARWHKTNPQELFPDYQYTIWIDGTIELLVPPEELVKQYLKYADMAVLNHPDRNCIYDEAEVCKIMKLDDPEIIDKQMARYKTEGYPKKNGLAETKIVLRRNIPETIAFSLAWSKEIKENSLRDQLSFDYCCWNVDVFANRMPTWKISDEYKYHFHLDRRKPK